MRKPLCDLILISFKVALDGSNHAPSPSHEKSGLPAQEKKNDESSSESSPAALVSEDRVSEFLSQVAGLVKYVTFFIFILPHTRNSDNEMSLEMSGEQGRKESRGCYRERDK